MLLYLIMTPTLLQDGTTDKSRFYLPTLPVRGMGLTYNMVVVLSCGLVWIGRLSYTNNSMDDYTDKGKQNPLELFTL